jgi:enamine deaminase RidA (YjgF/YER057c/UK114 family)
VSGITRRHRDGGGWEERAGYSRVVRRFGRIAVSGTTANADDGSALHPSDTYRQTLVALQRSIAATESLGGRLEDVVLTRVYLVPGADWEGGARAHAEVMGPVARPPQCFTLRR